jgi:N-acetyl-anhydromuramyl-L-alanine amidase AmpD
MKTVVLYYYNTNREEQECSILSVNYFPDDATQEEILDTLNPGRYRHYCIHTETKVNTFVPSSKKVYVADTVSQEEGE